MSEIKSYAMQERIENLQKQIKQLQAKQQEAIVSVILLLFSIVEKDKLINRLVNALEKHGQHTPQCIGSKSVKCICQFGKTLEAAKKAVGK